MSRRPSSPPERTAEPQTPRMRLDKWLWAARFYKTRSLAAEALERGRVQLDGQNAKPSREVRPGDRLAIRQGSCPVPREVLVLGLSALRGPAPAAQALYCETEASRAAQADWAAQRHLHAEPAASIEQGRPTKAARRQLADWQRWSASLDDED